MPMTTQNVLRIARPTNQLRRLATMYMDGLGLSVLAEFEDHDGFDGVILGRPGEAYHLEFTTHRGHTAGRAAADDLLLVFYVVDRREWGITCLRMARAGFRNVDSANPFWNVHGRTFEDPDGYRVVLQNTSWPEGTRETPSVP